MSRGSLYVLATNHNRAGPIFGRFETLHHGTFQRELQSALVLSLTHVVMHSLILSQIRYLRHDSLSSPENVSPIQNCGWIVLARRLLSVTSFIS